MRTNFVLRLTAAAVATLVLIVVIGILVATNTPWGHAAVRRLALRAVRGPVHGIVRIGRIDGDLLSEVVISDLAISDSAGAPFLVVSRAELHYNLIDLVRQRLYFHHVRLLHPVVVLTQSPDKIWNYKALFRSSNTASDTTKRGWGSWIAASDLGVIDGDVTVRSPWHPDSTLRGAARDSAIRVALSPESRIAVTSVAGGLEKTVAVHEISANVPALRLADPGHPIQVARVASLGADIAAFRPPDATVRNVTGTFYFTSDSIWWPPATVALPASRINGRGMYELNTGDLTLQLHADPAALGDLRFLDPRLPDSGAVSGDIGVRWRGKVQDYVAQHARGRIGAAQISGQLGLRMSDTVAFYDTDLRFAEVDTRLIEQLAPQLRLPREGEASGRASLSGGLRALSIDADVTFDDRLTGRSHVVAVGEVGVGSGFRARGLNVTLDPLQAALAAPPTPSLPVAGTITGHVTLDGSTEGTVTASADLVHHDGAGYSHLVANGDVAFAPSSPTNAPQPSDWPRVRSEAVRHRGDTNAAPTGPAGVHPSHLDVTATLDPIDLTEVGKFVPAAKLRGHAAGSVQIHGDLGDLTVHSRMTVAGAPDSGLLAVDGHLDLASDVPRYDLSASSHVFDAHAVSSAAPPTAITATATARGRGTTPATMVASFAADVQASVFDSTAIDTLHVRASVEQGQLRVSAAHLRALASTADVHGELGLIPGHSGALQYRVAVDSLHALRRFMPPDTTVVSPRPARVAAAVNRARADSARAAQATEVERAINGAPPPPLAIDTPATLHRDTLAGRAVAAGTIEGEIHRFDLRGDLDADSLIALGNSVQHTHAEYRWVGGPDPHAPLAIALELDTSSLRGFAFERLHVRASYQAPSGTLRLEARQDPLRQYAINSLFRWTPTVKEVRFDTLALRFANTVWRASQPGSVEWGAPGIVVHHVALTNGGRGLITIDGALPARSAPDADLRLTVRHFDLADLAAIAQSDVALRGELSAQATVTGTPDAPRLRGQTSVSSAWVNAAPLPNMYVHVLYDTATLLAHAEMAPKGAPSAPFATADALVPVNLALGATGPRVPDRPVRAEVRLDSLPLDVLPQFTQSVRDVAGRVTGHVTVRGTMRRLDPEGTVALDNGAATIAASGTALRDMVARIRLTRDSLVIDSAVARTPATGGLLRVSGSLDRTDPAVPVLNATATATNARVVSTRERGRVDLDAKIVLGGPTIAPFLSGNATVRSAVIYLPESNGKHPITLNDPAVFYVADTSDAAIRKVLPVAPIWLSSAKMDVDISVLRDCWVRNKDANVEAYTPEPITVRIDQARRAIVLDGTVATDRGEYAFLGKRFVITKGAATFIGTPDLNPTISATGEYDVPVPGRQALAILINIGGSLDSLRISLSSNTEPPIPQSDLLSYLAFSRPTSGLTQQSQSSSLSGATSGGVVGTASAFVQQQLAAEALGVLTDQVKGDLARSLGADVLDVTTGNAYTDIAQSHSATAFFQNTQVEFGKYFTPATYVALQASVAPGGRVVHRVGNNLSLQLSGEPIYLLGEPTLSTTQRAPLTGVFGLSLIRTWRF